MKIEAQVMISKCFNKKVVGIRVEKREGDWMMTWAFPIDEKKASSEGYTNTQMTGSFCPTESFQGCPYCGTKEFLLCGNCGRVSCFHAGDQNASCQWCNNSGTITKADQTTVSGGSM